jgi:hypothetical protein
MDVILQERIKQKIYQLDNVKDHVTVPHIIVVDSPTMVLDIGNAFFFLTSKNLNDIEVTANLLIRSSDNTFKTSQLEYDNLELSRYECFRDYLEIKISNYTDFKPFKLEFLKVQPIYHDHN